MRSTSTQAQRRFGSLQRGGSAEWPLNAQAAQRPAANGKDSRYRSLAAAAVAGSGSGPIRTQLPIDWAYADKNAPLYAHMAEMPRLPIPELPATLAKYLKVQAQQQQP